MIIATVTGNLGKDAELRAAGNGQVCSFSIASEEKVKGEKTTTWIGCAIFGKRGEALCPHLSKGTRVTAVGKLKTREHNGKTYLDIEVFEIALQGGGKPSGERSAPAPAATAGGGYDGYDEPPAAPNLDDDFPF
jgi:single-strand DNA-binding protein